MAEPCRANRRESVADDRVGKLFIMVVTPEISLRECLVCGELFTREASREHSHVPCQPSPQQPFAAVIDSLR